MTSASDLNRLYSHTLDFYLGVPVLRRPAGKADLEVTLSPEGIRLTCERVPRHFGTRIDVQFRWANQAYFFEAVHRLQVLGGAGSVWRKVHVQGTDHWRSLRHREEMTNLYLGRPWDWPDELLVLPDPIYTLDPAAPETSYACLTPLVPYPAPAPIAL